MGNSPSDNYHDLDTSIEKRTYSKEEHVAEIMRHYKHFDDRLDHRFKNVVLFKNHNNVVVAKIQHAFNNFSTFSDYYDMYCAREKIGSKALLKIHHKYTEKEKDYQKVNYCINLFIEYPYNDLKNEVTVRKLQSQRFDKFELVKILKAGVEALYRFKQAEYAYDFVIDQHSICLFSKPHSKTFTVRILEFNVKAYVGTRHERAQSKMDDPLMANAKHLATTILEAGLMINEMMIYKNITNFRLYRLFDEFQNIYRDPELISVVDGFLKSTLTVEDAFNTLNKKKLGSERFIFKDNAIMTNDRFRKNSGSPFKTDEFIKPSKLNFLTNN